MTFSPGDLIYFNPPKEYQDYYYPGYYIVLKQDHLCLTVDRPIHDGLNWIFNFTFEYIQNLSRL
jgi:signal peptidase I